MNSSLAAANLRVANFPLSAMLRRRNPSSYDELKSHLFSAIFLIYFYLKRLIYVKKYGITNQIVMQQGIQEKKEFLQKKGQHVDEHH